MIRKELGEKKYKIEACNQKLELNQPIFLLERVFYKPVIMLEYFVVVVVVADSCCLTSTSSFFPGMCMIGSTLIDTKQVTHVKKKATV